MRFRLAKNSDVALIAQLNQQLIRDEGHRNSMKSAELEERMARWLSSKYEAVLFESSGKTVGYALFRRELTSVYLRQFYVCPDCRRQGSGRAAVDWLRQHVWQDAELIRLEVLCENSVGLEFWRAIGFYDYCVTLELNQRPSSQ